MRFFYNLLAFLLISNFAFAQRTVVDVIVQSAQHNTLETAVISAGLVETLKGAGPFTVFAPTDAAFNALPAETLAALLQDSTGALSEILTYHVVGDSIVSSGLSDGQKFMTLNGKSITVNISNDSIFINDAYVSFANITADNGVVHVIDAVLLKPRETVVDIIVNSEMHTILEVAIGAASLVETLSGDGPFTVFAPTDAAFAALSAETIAALLQDPTGALTNILTYHVVETNARASSLSDEQMVMTLNGKNVTVNISNDSVFIYNAYVSMADIETDNGVVHVIDAVLLPPRVTVVDVIVNSEVHNRLEVAVKAAGLVETLIGDGPFTVFAPTDAAFAALPTGTVETLLQDPTGALTDILLYHVVGTKALSSQLSDGQNIVMLNTDSVMISIFNDSIFINNAYVSIADIETDNGVVHIIDAVVLPPQVTVADVILNSDVHTTLGIAIVAAGLVETLSGDGPFSVFAPTDAAFAALPAGTVETLLQDPMGDLTDILLNHVVGSTTLSFNLSDGQMLQTLNGQSVMVSISNDSVFINDAYLSIANIETGNGVVHVIDAVLLPNPTSVLDLQSASIDVSVYPNPASDQLNIRLEDSSISNAQVIFWDINGRQLRREVFERGIHNIDVSTISQGVYFLEIRIGNQRYQQSVVINRKN